MYSTELLRTIASSVNVDIFRRCCARDFQLLVIPHHGGTQIEVMLEWTEFTGMGSESETEVLFKGPNKLAFTFLCELVQL